VLGGKAVEFFEPERNNSNLTANLAFNSIVSSTFKLYLRSHNKPFIQDYDLSTLGFDFFLPDGLDSLEPTYIEVKYSLNLSQVDKLATRIGNIYTDTNYTQTRVIIVIGTSLSHNERKLYKKVLSVDPKVRVDVWDYEDLNNFAGDIYGEFLSTNNNPSKVLINDAINNQNPNNSPTQLRDSFITQLKREYEHDKVVLVLGAGVSISMGVPNWNQLITILQAEMIIHLVKDKSKLPSVKTNQILDLANKNINRGNVGSSPLAQMRFIRSALSCEVYNKMVHRALYSNVKNSSSQLLEAICDICRPSRNIAGVNGIITYNFDDLLEQSLTRAKIDCKFITKDDDLASNDALNIFHVHGYLPQKISNLSQDLGLVFSEEEYHQVYQNPYSWSNLIQINCFRDKTCVFIGSSLSDPNLRRLLDISSRKGENPHHFAFLLRPNEINNVNNNTDSALVLYREIEENLTNSYYKTLGLNIIWVDSFDEVPELLMRLK